MPQFTSSAKPVQYFRQTTLIDKFASAVGDRLEPLEQIERYQLLICLSTCLELLEHEDSECIAAILPAIAEYVKKSSAQKENADH